MTTAEILAAARAKKAGGAGALQHPLKRSLRLRLSRLRSSNRRR